MTAIYTPFLDECFHVFSTACQNTLITWHIFLMKDIESNLLFTLVSSDGGYAQSKWLTEVFWCEISPW